MPNNSSNHTRAADKARISSDDPIAGLSEAEAVIVLKRLIEESREDIETGRIYKPNYKHRRHRYKSAMAKSTSSKVRFDTPEDEKEQDEWETISRQISPVSSPTASAISPTAPAPPEGRKLKIKLRVNGEPPSRPKLLCVVGGIPKGCETIVEGLRLNPYDKGLLEELRARGYRAVADPPRTRHRCWCPTCDGAYNKGVYCCAITVRARFGDGGDNSHKWA